MTAIQLALPFPWLIAVKIKTKHSGSLNAQRAEQQQ